jgi:hypothetical protein
MAATFLASIATCVMAEKLANGVLGDCLGWWQAITLFLVLQTGMVPCLYGTWHPWPYDVVGVLFGIGMGGPPCIYALLLREFFGQQAIGSMLGVTAMYSTGMAVGGLIDGFLHRRFDGYTEAFVLSGLTGTIMPS